MPAQDVKQLLLQVDASVELLRRNMIAGENQVAQFERNTDRNLTRFERNMRRAETASNGLNQQFSNLRSSAAAVGLGFGALQLGQYIGESLTYASSLGEVAQQLGVTTKDLQVYRYIASQVGIEQGTMDKSLARLTRTIGEAATGSEKQQKLFKTLGISIRDAKGEIKTAGDVIPELADRLASVASPAQRGAVEVKAFGKSGQELDTMLAGGSQGIRQMTSELESMRGILSDDEIQNADELADKFEKLKLALKIRIASVLTEDSSALQGFMGDVENLARSIGQLIGYFKELERARLNLQKIEGTLQANSFNLYARPAGRAKVADAERQLRALDAPPTPRPSQPQTPAQRGGSAAGLDLDDLNGGGSGRDEEPKFTSRRQAIGVAIRELEALGLNVSGNYQSRGGYTGGHENNRDHNENGADVNVGVGKVEASDPVTKAKFDAIARSYQSRGFRVIWDGEVYEPGANGPGGKAKGHKDHLDIKAPESIVGKPQKGGEDTSTEIYQAEQRAAEEAERARKEALDRQFRADDEIAQAKVEQLRSQQQLSTDYTEQTRLGLKIVDAETARFNAATDHRVQMGEITQAHADQLKALHGIVAANDKTKLNADEQAKRSDEYERLEQRDFEARMDLLRLQADLATTASERREVELRILRLAREEERRRAQAIIDDPSATFGDKEDARRAIGDLEDRAPAEEQGVRNRTRGPLEEYRASIPDTAAEMDEAFQQVAAGGLKSLEDGLVDAIVNARSLGDVFKGVAKQILADLIRIAIQQTVVNGLLGAIGGAFGGGAAKGGFVSSGNLLGNMDGAISFGGARASGGPVRNDRVYKVNEHGPELFIPSTSGTIVSNAQLRQGRGGSPAAGGVIRVMLESDDEMFRGRVREVSGQVVAEAAPRLVGAAQSSTLRKAGRPGIMG